VGENPLQGRQTRCLIAYQHAWGSSEAWSHSRVRSWPGACWTHLSRQATCKDVGEREHGARFPPPLRRITDEHGTRDVPRSALGEPRLLDLHPPHAADGTGIRAGGWRGRRGDRVHRRARLGGRQEGLSEELSTAWELHRALPIREESIVPHPLEAPRQDVQEKAPNEFDRVKGHEALALASLVILPPERHLAIVTGEKPPIRDGHTMCVTGQVA
jgi:hypothetical protein